MKQALGGKTASLCPFLHVRMHVFVCFHTPVRLGCFIHCLPHFCAPVIPPHAAAASPRAAYCNGLVATQRAVAAKRASHVPVLMLLRRWSKYGRGIDAKIIKQLSLKKKTGFLTAFSLLLGIDVTFRRTALKSGRTCIPAAMLHVRAASLLPCCSPNRRV